MILLEEEPYSEATPIRYYSGSASAVVAVSSETVTRGTTFRTPNTSRSKSSTRCFCCSRCCCCCGCCCCCSYISTHNQVRGHRIGSNYSVHVRVVHGSQYLCMANRLPDGNIYEVIQVVRLAPVDTICRACRPDRPGIRMP